MCQTTSIDYQSDLQSITLSERNGRTGTYLTRTPSSSPLISGEQTSLANTFFTSLEGRLNVPSNLSIASQYFFDF